MKRPNAILHMLVWTIVSATLGPLAFSTLYFLWGLGLEKVLEKFADLAKFNLQHGGLLGAGVGLVTGLVLWKLTEDIQAPFTWREMRSQSPRITRIIEITAIVLSVLIVAAYYGYESFSGYKIFPFGYQFPPFAIAMVFVITYAARRYLLRLWRWYGENFEEEEKVKNSDLIEETG